LSYPVRITRFDRPAGSGAELRWKGYGTTSDPDDLTELIVAPGEPIAITTENSYDRFNVDLEA
jgi:hypothetical protein